MQLNDYKSILNVERDNILEWIKQYELKVLPEDLKYIDLSQKTATLLVQVTNVWKSTQMHIVGIFPKWCDQMCILIPSFTPIRPLIYNCVKNRNGNLNIIISLDSEKLDVTDLIQKLQTFISDFNNTDFGKAREELGVNATMTLMNRFFNLKKSFIEYGTNKYGEDITMSAFKNYLYNTFKIDSPQFACHCIDMLNRGKVEIRRFYTNKKPQNCLAFSAYSYWNLELFSKLYNVKNNKNGESHIFIYGMRHRIYEQESRNVQNDNFDENQWLIEQWNQYGPDSKSNSRNNNYLITRQLRNTVLYDIWDGDFIPRTNNTSTHHLHEAIKSLLLNNQSKSLSPNNNINDQST